MKKSFGKLFVLAVIALSLSAPSVGYSTVQVGVVNEAKLMKEATAIKKFQEKITKFQGEFKAMILSHAQEIDKAAGKLLKKKDTLSKEELNKKVTALTARQKEVSTRDQQLAKKIEKALLPALNKIKDAIDSAVKSVAKKKGYDIVYDKSKLAYSADSLDITSDVLKVLNTSLKTVKVDLPKLK